MLNVPGIRALMLLKAICAEPVRRVEWCTMTGESGRRGDNARRAMSQPLCREPRRKKPASRTSAINRRRDGDRAGGLSARLTNVAPEMMGTPNAMAVRSPSARAHHPKARSATRQSAARSREQSRSPSSMLPLACWSRERASWPTQHGIGQCDADCGDRDFVDAMSQAAASRVSVVGRSPPRGNPKTPHTNHRKRRICKTPAEDYGDSSQRMAPIAAGDGR